MARAYRIWDGEQYIAKFEVEDEEHPKAWAYRMQSEGYDIEVGTMAWDDRDICYWEWEKKRVRPSERTGGIPRMSYAFVKKFLDAKAECETIRDVSDKLSMCYKKACTINSHINKPYYKNYVQMWELGITEYHDNYKETITEKIFNEVWDKHEEGLTQTLIGEILNVKKRTVCDIVNLTTRKYREFKEKRDVCDRN